MYKTLLTIFSPLYKKYFYTLYSFSYKLLDFKYLWKFYFNVFKVKQHFSINLGYLNTIILNFIRKFNFNKNVYILYYINYLGKFSAFFAQELSTLFDKPCFKTISSIKQELKNLCSDLVESDFEHIGIYIKNKCVLLLFFNCEVFLKLDANIVKGLLLGDYQLCFMVLTHKIDDKKLKYFFNTNNIDTKNFVFEDLTCRQSFSSSIKFISHIPCVYLKNFLYHKLKYCSIDFVYRDVSYLYNIINNFKGFSGYKYCCLDYDNKFVNTYFATKLRGQDNALDSFFTYVDRFKKGLFLPGKPLGSWLLCGPSGTGKTELAKVLAYALFGSTINLVSFNMSEYMESHSISKFLGSPPGYVGYGEESVLSSRINNNNYYVILFDEIEKAHKNINDLMLQVLDEGRLTLSDNTVVNFDKSFIIFTSNLGYSTKEEVMSATVDTVFASINDFFRIEFLNRLNDIIVFNSLSFSVCCDILGKFMVDFCNGYGVSGLGMSRALRSELVSCSYNLLYGSRPLRRLSESVFNRVLTYNFKVDRNLRHCFGLGYSSKVCCVKNIFCV